MVPAKHRVLRSNQNLLKNTVERVLKYLDEHKVIQRYTTFRSEMKEAGRKSITEAEQKILNGMDNDVTRAMLSAEKAGERKYKHP
jgi:2-phosphoglycerate kinase